MVLIIRLQGGTLRIYVPHVYDGNRGVGDICCRTNYDVRRENVRTTQDYFLIFNNNLIFS